MDLFKGAIIFSVILVVGCGAGMLVAENKVERAPQARLCIESHTITHHKWVPKASSTKIGPSFGFMKYVPVTETVCERTADARIQ